MMPSIFVVDDELINLKIYQSILTQYNFLNCKYCFDSKKALNHLLNNKYDIIVLDYMMPDLDGISLCQELRKEESINKNSIIILCSSSVSGNIENSIIKKWFDYFFEKPVPVPEFINYIKSIRY